jgi:hypothetical protein
MDRAAQLRRCAPAAGCAVLRSAAAMSAVLRARSVMKGALAIAARQLTYVVGLVCLLPAMRANVKNVMGPAAPVSVVLRGSTVSVARAFPAQQRV